LKQIDVELDDVDSVERLHSLSLFSANRAALLEIGIIPALTLILKTKTDRVKDTIARTLQLYAQDGGESCNALRKLNLCKSLLELMSRVDADSGARTSIAGLIYWLA
jgi:hypothetical protein